MLYVTKQCILRWSDFSNRCPICLCRFISLTQHYTNPSSTSIIQIAHRDLAVDSLWDLAEEWREEDYLARIQLNLPSSSSLTTLHCPFPSAFPTLLPSPSPASSDAAGQDQTTHSRSPSPHSPSLVVNTIFDGDGDWDEMEREDDQNSFFHFYRIPAIGNDSDEEWQWTDGKRRNQHSPLSSSESDLMPLDPWRCAGGPAVAKWRKLEDEADEEERGMKQVEHHISGIKCTVEASVSKLKRKSSENKQKKKRRHREEERRSKKSGDG
ncbi:hypothetical protein BLNAU_22037 [Blattamonas nauphoetae]|uniref:Uncharacterized protein n=1 Tax=Blattamonas nauphoetae TaxID=2049346 RepID=A0ABQ9WUQ3_9EUKA|nr:hypothetical protein BLNAU_22037 [Blattamonas nauphoetae]